MVKQHITGIILAGGAGKRMGAEKGLIKFRGREMIKYAIEALRPICDEILISANSNAYDHLGFQVIPDEVPGCGPMGGILSCIKKSNSQDNFVLSCDMPLVSEITISEIIRESNGYEVAVPWHGGNYFEPLCAVYKKVLIPEFEKFVRMGNFRIPDLINTVTSNKIKTGAESSLDEKIFFNVNSLADLEKLSETEKYTPVNPPEINVIPNLLMIAGTGRNVGKTTFACNIISHFARNHPVTAIKISPHLHHQAEGQKIVASEADFQFIEETKSTGGTDSSRMLKAGAEKVFYLQTRDRNIKAPFEQLIRLIPKDQPVICESGALLNHARPGLFVLIKRDGQTAFKKGLDKLSYEPDTWVTFYGDHFSIEPDGFNFNDSCWKLKKLGS